MIYFNYKEGRVKNEIINEVTDSPGSGNILNVKYQDNQVHKLPSYSDHGITISSSITFPMNVNRKGSVIKSPSS